MSMCDENIINLIASYTEIILNWLYIRTLIKLCYLTSSVEAVHSQLIFFFYDNIQLFLYFLLKFYFTFFICHCIDCFGTEIFMSKIKSIKLLLLYSNCCMLQVKQEVVLTWVTYIFGSFDLHIQKRFLALLQAISLPGHDEANNESKMHSFVHVLIIFQAKKIWHRLKVSLIALETAMCTCAHWVTSRATELGCSWSNHCCIRHYSHLTKILKEKINRKLPIWIII